MRVCSLALACPFLTVKIIFSFHNKVSQFFFFSGNVSGHAILAVGAGFCFNFCFVTLCLSATSHDFIWPTHSLILVHVAED